MSQALYEARLKYADDDPRQAAFIEGREAPANDIELDRAALELLHMQMDNGTEKGHKDIDRLWAFSDMDFKRIWIKKAKRITDAMHDALLHDKSVPQVCLDSMKKILDKSKAEYGKA